MKEYNFYDDVFYSKKEADKAIEKLRKVIERLRKNARDAEAKRIKEKIIKEEGYVDNRKWRSNKASKPAGNNRRK